MKYNTESYKAKPKAIKIKTIEKGMTIKELSKEVGMHYHALIAIGTGRHQTSKMRAKIIASELGAKVEDLFEAVEQ